MEGNLRQPEPIRIKDNPNVGEEWLEWKEELECFLDAIAVPEGSDKRRIAYLQVIGGKDVRTIFKTLVFETAADRKS